MNKKITCFSYDIDIMIANKERKDFYKLPCHTKGVDTKLVTEVSSTVCGLQFRD